MSETLSIRVPVGTREKLDQIGALTKRSRSYLAAEAVERYIESELAIIEGIVEGLADVADNQVVPHREATRELRAMLTSGADSEK